jgi:hypothetical protein
MALEMLIFVRHLFNHASDLFVLLVLMEIMVMFKLVNELPMSVVGW